VEGVSDISDSDCVQGQACVYALDDLRVQTTGGHGQCAVSYLGWNSSSGASHASCASLVGSTTGIRLWSLPVIQAGVESVVRAVAVALSAGSHRHCHSRHVVLGLERLQSQCHEEPSHHHSSRLLESTVRMV